MTRRPWTSGAALAAAGAVIGLATLLLQQSGPGTTWREVDALAVALVVLMAAPAATCRRAPVASAVVALTAALTSAALGYPPTAGWFCALLVATAAVYLTDRRRALTLAGGAVAGDVLASVAAAHATGLSLGAYELVANVCVIVVPLVLADLLREQHHLVHEVRDQAARLAELRGGEAREAEARERVRIAREVHDVVGQHLSAIAVQAAAGSRLARADENEASAAFVHIAAVAREALAQTRAAVQRMRDGDMSDADPGAPPGLDDLDTLLEAFRASGVDVHLLERPPERVLAPEIEATAFRIVQEALTNVVRHARPARAHVSIRVRGGETVIEVVDAGARHSEPAGRGSGILGMRERATLAGGHLDVGPNPDGDGWRVRAVLPAGSTTAATAVSR
jgi:signal transduction histidine kinase